jgi:hypothetical protein
VFLDKTRNEKNDYHGEILESLKKELNELMNADYVDKIMPFLNSNLMCKSVENYNEMIKDNKYEQKLYSGFITITHFLTDLYLALSKYGDFFYNEEKIKNKINIKMDKNFIHSKIPPNTIALSADIDRRTTVVEFKSYHPTAHKVSVLIVRYFEERLSCFEETIKDIGVKLYYLVPKVTKEGYDLENQNFEAYIPKLLPLLIGDNLYKEKFVFIRELIQNSMDAILLRKGIENKDSNDDIITIEFGKESEKDIKDANRSSPKSFIKISDNGIGMDTYKIERYLTSIGRSFYTSEEFDELQKEKGITYNPISNFGIGFLSVFLVADEVKIKTRYFEDSKIKTGDFGIEVIIPNYEGCFFIKKLEKNEYNQGTEITLYLKEENKAIEDELVKYISSTMLDIEIPIKIKRTDKTELVVNKCQIRNQFMHEPNSPLFKLEIKDGKVKKLTDKDSKSSKSIMFFKFFAENKNWKDLNNGILMKESKNRFLENVEYCDILIGYPAEAIQLDVSREKIVSYKKNKKSGNDIFNPNDIETKKDILKELKIQFSEWLNEIKPNTKISNYKINHIHRFFISNNYEMNDLSNNFFKIFIWIEDKKIKFKFSNFSNDSSINKNECICFTNNATFNFKEIKSKKEILNKILENISKGDFGRDLEGDLEGDFGRYFERYFGRDFGRYFERDFGRDFGRDFEEILERDFERFFERFLKEIFERFLEEIFGNILERDFEEIFGRDFERKFLVLVMNRIKNNYNKNTKNEHIIGLLFYLQYVYLFFTVVINYDKEIDLEIEV